MLNCYIKTYNCKTTIFFSDKNCFFNKKSKKFYYSFSKLTKVIADSVNRFSKNAFVKKGYFEFFKECNKHFLTNYSINSNKIIIESSVIYYSSNFINSKIIIRYNLINEKTKLIIGSVLIASDGGELEINGVMQGLNIGITYFFNSQNT